MNSSGRHKKDAGIVLTTWPFGEKDLLVNLFCKERGLLPALARGARHNPNRFGPYLSPGSIAQFEFYKGPHRVHVTSCEGQLTFIGGGLSLDSSLKLMEFIKNFHRMLLEEKPQTRLFEMTVKTLTLVYRFKNFPQKLYDCFFLKFLAFQGICPPFKRCNSCQTLFLKGDRVFFHFLDHHFLCFTCGREAPQQFLQNFSGEEFTKLLEFHQGPLEICFLDSLDPYEGKAIQGFYEFLLREHIGNFQSSGT